MYNSTVIPFPLTLQQIELIKQGGIDVIPFSKGHILVAKEKENLYVNEKYFECINKKCKNKSTQFKGTNIIKDTNMIQFIIYCNNCKKQFLVDFELKHITTHEVIQ